MSQELRDEAEIVMKELREMLIPISNELKKIQNNQQSGENIQNRELF